MKRIAIHSVPRSGSTWLGAIFNSHPQVCFRFQPLFSYSFKNYLTDSSSSEEVDSFFKALHDSADSFINQEEGKKQGIIPIFKKSAHPTHLCYKEVRYHHILKNLLEKDQEVKVIGLVRNPFSTVSSWLNAPKEFRGDLGWKIEEEWRFAPKKNANQPEEFNGFEKWKEVTYLFLTLQKQYPNRFYLLKYGDLLKDTVDEVTGLFRFCGLNLPGQTLAFINNSTGSNDADPYSVFKSKSSDDQWKSDLHSFVKDEIVQDPAFNDLNNIFHWI
jgi:hypothetical protein